MEFSLHNIQCQLYCYEILPCNICVTIVQHVIGNPNNSVLTTKKQI